MLNLKGQSKILRADFNFQIVQIFHTDFVSELYKTNQRNTEARIVSAYFDRTTNFMKYSRNWEYLQ